MADESYDYRAICPTCGKTWTIHGMLGYNGMAYECDTCRGIRYSKEKAELRRNERGCLPVIAIVAPIALFVWYFLR
jgi:hypothetical protein